MALEVRSTREVDPATESLRLYLLGNAWKRRVGAKPSLDLDGPLVM